MIIKRELKCRPRMLLVFLASPGCAGETTTSQSDIKMINEPQIYRFYGWDESRRRGWEKLPEPFFSFFRLFCLGGRTFCLKANWAKGKEKIGGHCTLCVGWSCVSWSESVVNRFIPVHSSRGASCTHRCSHSVTPIEWLSLLWLVGWITCCTLHKMWLVLSSKSKHGRNVFFVTLWHFIYLHTFIRFTFIDPSKYTSL